MTTNYIKQRIAHLALDPEIFPETVEYLESIRNLDSISSYKLALSLVDCDRGSVMTRELFDFIVELYEEVINTCDTQDYKKVWAMVNLGALYYDGRGINQDFTKAVYYYDTALENGCHEVLENLGYCYYYGRTGSPDYEKAFHCFAQLAFEGNICALYKIGDMYRNGYYVRKDLDEAFRIYSRCEDSIGHETKDAAGPVFLRLGKAYFYGEGTCKNFREALSYFQRAEYYLYNMVMSGDVMYRKSLQAAIEYQAQARSELMKDLPGRTWPNE